MKVSHLSISDKITLLVYGCNFKCKYCFFNPIGCTNLQVERLSDIIYDLGDHYNLKRLIIAGGEPTLQGELPTLTRFLYGNFYMILSTNGSHLLDIIGEIEVDEVHVNLKAFNNRKHRILTSKSNNRVLKAIEYLGENKKDLKFKVEISTVLIPGIIGVPEIKEIAKFISEWDLPYHIIAHVPSRLDAPRPTRRLVEEAKKAGQEYLSNVSTSLESRRHIKGEKIII